MLHVVTCYMLLHVTCCRFLVANVVRKLYNKIMRFMVTSVCYTWLPKELGVGQEVFGRHSARKSCVKNLTFTTNGCFLRLIAKHGHKELGVGWEGVRRYIDDGGGLAPSLC